MVSAVCRVGRKLPHEIGPDRHTASRIKRGDQTLQAVSHLLSQMAAQLIATLAILSHEPKHEGFEFRAEALTLLLTFCMRGLVMRHAVATANCGGSVALSGGSRGSAP